MTSPASVRWRGSRCIPSPSLRDGEGAGARTDRLEKSGVRSRRALRRRSFIALAGAAACPHAPRAQPARRHRVGVLTPSLVQWDSQTFAAAMRALGYVEGENLAIDLRSAEDELDRRPALAAELARSAPGVIIAVNTPGVRAAIETGTNLPIVMGIVGDPIASGFVTNLARPGGNVTGVSNNARDLAAKRLSLLKEAAPQATRIAAFMNPDDPIALLDVREAETAAAALGVELRRFAIRGVSDLAPAFAALVEWRAQALYRAAGQSVPVAAPTIELALRHRLPHIMTVRRDVELGALMSYYADFRALTQRVAAQVDRILRGTPPGELPVEQPTRFELVINLRTARAIGLDLPATILALADEVIE